MPSPAKREEDKALSQAEHQPTKGGTERASDKPQPSGDSPKPHGDPFKDDLAKRK